MTDGKRKGQRSIFFVLRGRYSVDRSSKKSQVNNIEL